MESPDFEPTNDVVQWMLNERRKRKFHDEDYLTNTSPSSSSKCRSRQSTRRAWSLPNVLYDLVARPEYIDILRSEVEEKRAANGHSLGGRFVKDKNSQLLVRVWMEIAFVGLEQVAVDNEDGDFSPPPPGRLLPSRKCR